MTEVDCTLTKSYNLVLMLVVFFYDGNTLHWPELFENIIEDQTYKMLYFVPQKIMNYEYCRHLPHQIKACGTIMNFTSMEVSPS